MQWPEYPLLYKAMATAKGFKQGTAHQLVEQITGGPPHTWSKDAATQDYNRLMQAEADWVLDGRPYYNVWPSVMEPFSKIALDKVDCLDFVPPLPSLLVRFGCGHEMPSAHSFPPAQCFLMARWVYLDKLRPGSFSHGPDGRTIHSIEAQNQVHYMCFAVWTDQWDARGPGYRFPTHQLSIVKLVAGKNMEQVVQEAIADLMSYMVDRHGQAFVEEATAQRVLLESCARMACAISMLNDNPDLIEPEPLEKDREKWEKTHDLALIERAHRKGKKVWNIGRNIETAPGFRRPHFAIRWMGRGPTVEKKPVLRPVKGCLVRRGALLEVPTGYLDEDESSVGA